MNRIVICGRLTAAPELRTTNSGMEVCNFTVAVDRRMKKDGEKQADFIDCTAWGKKGVFVSTYFHKGDGITVEGRMESRKWVDQDGNNRTSWGVTVDEVEFAFGRGAAAGTASEEPEPPEFSPEDEEDGDLPF